MTTSTDSTLILETELTAVEKLYSGKVRDVYAVDDDHLLIIATDRVSAYDVILPDGIPGKGRLLTRIALFWFSQMADVAPNHLTDVSLRDVLPTDQDFYQAEGRSMIVKRLKALPLEAVVRGYLIGSGYKDYLAAGSVCGLGLPEGLRIAEQLPEPIFTPATKAAAGDHDENIDYQTAVELVGSTLAEEIRRISLELYRRAATYALERNIIIADTKFEFGLDQSGQLTLMDEILTPDSSRFWQADTWQPGHNPASYDKQYVRDYLETLDWDKTAPGPDLPADIIAGTLSRYEEAYARLTSG